MSSIVVTILFFGLAYGMLLYITSVGLSITMGLMGFVNLAHGVFAMLGGYATFTLMNSLAMPFFPALFCACIIVTLLGYVLERLLYQRLYGATELDQVLFSMALIFISVAIARMVWGPRPQPILLPDYLKGHVTFLAATIPKYRLFLLIFGTVIAAGLWLGFDRTLFGARVRAAVENHAMAEAVGINTSRLFALTFAIGTGLAALGGALGAEILEITPGYPLQYIIFFLMVVAVGGLGSIKGPLYAALVIGLADTAAKYLIPQVGTIFVFVFVFILLLWRPQGIISPRKG